MKEQQEEFIRMDIDYFKELFAESSDIQFTNHLFLAESGRRRDVECTIFYSNVLIDSEKLAETIMNLENSFFTQIERERKSNRLPLNDMQLTMVPQTTKQEEIADKLFSGYVFVLFEQLNSLFSFNLQKIPNRTIEEPNSEVSYRGPRDGLIEDISTNIGLIRKRYRTSTLINEGFVIGKRGKTKVSLLYVKDVMNAEIIEQVREKLQAINTDVLLGTIELEESLVGEKFSLIPLLEYSGRPDYLVSCLNNGRFVILVDGAASAVIGPANITFLLQTAEDIHSPFYYANFEMVLRLIGLSISIFLPGFYIALVSFQLEQLPFPFLATIAVARRGLPLSPSMEAFLVLALFELFQEAGITLPKAIGQTLAVVGGIIIGDAAIRGGLTSPTMLVVAGVTSVSAYILANHSLAASVSIMRLWVLLLSSFFGLFGFFLGVFSITLYISRLQSFGIPYLAPLSPFFLKDFMKGVFVIPDLLKKKRPSILRTKDKTRG